MTSRLHECPDDVQSLVWLHYVATQASMMPRKRLQTKEDLSGAVQDFANAIWSAAAPMPRRTTFEGFLLDLRAAAFVRGVGRPLQWCDALDLSARDMEHYVSRRLEYMLSE